MALLGVELVEVIGGKLHLRSVQDRKDPAALEELRVRYLGKKGELTAVLKQMGKLSLLWGNALFSRSTQFLPYFL